MNKQTKKGAPTNTTHTRRYAITHMYGIIQGDSLESLSRQCKKYGLLAEDGESFAARNKAGFVVGYVNSNDWRAV